MLTTPQQHQQHQQLPTGEFFLMTTAGTDDTGNVEHNDVEHWSRYYLGRYRLTSLTYNKQRSYQPLALMQMMNERLSWLRDMTQGTDQEHRKRISGMEKETTPTMLPTTPTTPGKLSLTNDDEDVE
ncbi:hypothetical protein BYT27DRAFT_7207417 [Phlegmacium glaucopus]|nr:hypothetical protein BYT27DRAFT_7207417 [Phlegmacium glaucopus]